MKLVIGFSDERCDVTVSFNRAKWNNMPRFHSHAFYELYYVVEGERYFLIGNRVYHIRRGDLLLISPEVEHRSLDVNGEGYERLVINVPRSHLPEGSHPVEELCMVRPDTELFAALSGEAGVLISAVEGGADALTAYIAVMRLLSIALSGRGEPCETEIASTTLDRMAEILGYLEEHYTEGIKLSALSERFYISEFYLCRLFKEYTGKTVLSYVTDLRIRRARKMLSATAEPVAKIARESGFGSVSAFGKAFKSSVGLSPREYRGAERKRQPMAKAAAKPEISVQRILRKENVKA